MAPFALAVSGPAAARGLIAELTVGGFVIAATNGFFALRLMHVAARRHSLPLPVPALSEPCRSVGLFGIGHFAVCVVGMTLALNSAHGARPAATASIGLAGLVVAAGGFVPGLLLLPGAARSVAARLRRCLDGLGVGVCLLFTVWVLVIAPNGVIDGLGFWVMLVACCTLSVSVVAGLRAAKVHRSALACAGGAALSVAGLAGLTLELAGDTDGFWPVVFTIALAVAPVVSWAGVRDAGNPTKLEPNTTAQATIAGLPVLAVPAAAAIAVALFRLVTGGEFDRPSVVLGISGITAIALRETFAALDVSRYARQVTTQEAQFRSLVAGSTDVTMVLDSDFVVRWRSPAAMRQFGLADSDVVGRGFVTMLHSADAAGVAERLTDILASAEHASAEHAGDGERPVLFEARLRDGSGQWRDTESSLSDLRQVPEVAGLVVHIRDISERKEMERVLHRLAFADQLTGLANRRQMLLSIIALRATSRASGALVLIELEGFTAVNDVRGYDVGDAVLVEVARRLRTGVGDSDLPARLGGDEFAVVTESSPVRAYAMATRLLALLSEPIAVAGVTVRLTASMGLADVAIGENGDDVMRRANLALRRAKQLGRGRVEWYDQAIEHALVRRMTLEQDLPEALSRGQLDLVYQPILDLERGCPVSVEALLRWRHPRLGTLLPADVIPVAQDIGVIGEIGGWVLRQSSRQLAMWLREGREVAMAVNVSAAQLDSEELCRDVAAVLKRHALPPDLLILEVAEGGLVADAESAACAAERLRELRGIGVRTALDDFGTGPDSLANLRRLPLDLVKIGRSFFDETPDSPDSPGQSLPIIDVMVSLGRRFGIDVVAQGLEVPMHLDVVRRSGCRFGQGHLFARPQPAERIEAYLDGFRAGPG